MQLPQHPWQFLSGNMKQRGIGEHALELRRRQIEGEKVLQPDFTATVGPRHFNKARAAIQAHGDMAHGPEGA